MTVQEMVAAARRWQARQALARHTRQLRAESSDTRKAAAEALGRLGDREAVEPLLGLLADGDEQVRCAAVAALGQLGDLRAFGPLTALLSNYYGINYVEDGQACQAAAVVLVQLDAGRAIEAGLSLITSPAEADRFAAALLLGASGDQRAVEPLVALLSTSTHAVQVGAAKALGLVGDHRAVEPLIDALSTSYFPTTDAAIEALGRLGDARAVDSLIDLLGRQFASRRIVADALGSIADPRAVEALTAVLDDPRVEVRRACALALKRILGTADLPPSTRQRILALAPRLARPHLDYTHDNGSSDCSQHDDKGIGVSL